MLHKASLSSPPSPFPLPLILLSFHPPPTPQAVACKAGGGWCAHHLIVSPPSSHHSTHQPPHEHLLARLGMCGVLSVGVVVCHLSAMVSVLKGVGRASVMWHASRGWEVPTMWVSHSLSPLPFPSLLSCTCCHLPLSPPFYLTCIITSPLLSLPPPFHGVSNGGGGCSLALPFLSSLSFILCHPIIFVACCCHCQ